MRMVKVMTMNHVMPVWITLLVGLLLPLVLFLGAPVAALAETQPTTTVDEIRLDGVMPQSPLQINRPKQAAPMASPLKMGYDVRIQMTPQDTRNLDILWGAVVAHNPVIQFGLRRLATPPEVRDKHNGLMARTVTGLVNSAAMVPYAMGYNQWTSGASVIGSNLVNRAVNQVNGEDVRDLPSDRELVELSSLVEELQQQVVTNYFGYKLALNEMIELDVEERRLWTQYKSAQATPDPMDDVWFYQWLMATQGNSYAAKSKAKQHLVLLTRLVGQENLELLRFDGEGMAEDPPQKPITQVSTRAKVVH